ncbi:MAG: response regulator [Eubacteriales bacterium]|nr:response regulator [Eubacteriales bacterium]
MMRVYVVDDEVPTLDLMVRTLQTFPEIEIVGAFGLPSAMLSRAKSDALAHQVSNQTLPDAAFLDISLPGMNGIELAMQLHEILPDLKVIFVTAFDQYALQAFDAAALDYVLKPVDRGRLERSIMRLSKQIADETAQPNQPANSPIAVNLAGRLQIVAPSGQLVRFTTKIQEALLRDLLTAGVGLNKLEIVSRYWPGLDLRRAEQNLYMTIYRLKQTFREYDLPFRLIVDKGHYRLEGGDNVTITSN